MNETQKLCWICSSAPADSGEHIVQASDVRAIFGKKLEKPLFMHDQTRNNRIIQGIDSRLLKFDKVICQTCNNKTTQPHDFAWQTFSNYMRQNKFKAGQKLRFNKIF